jgi:hypothetical protein
MDTVKKQWEDYRDKLIPDDASEIELRDCKQAFYAGMMSFFRLQFSITDDMDEDTGAEMMDVWFSECEQFFDGLIVTRH